jgi:hypothetical protein
MHHHLHRTVLHIQRLTFSSGFEKIIDKMTGLKIDILMSKYKFLYDVTGINEIVKQPL